MATGNLSGTFFNVEPPASVQTVVQQKLSEHFSNVGPVQFSPIGGSSTGCYCIAFGNETVFCKTASALQLPGFLQKEKAGLELIARQAIISTPAIIDCFEHEGTQLLLLEWIPPGKRTETFWKLFGERLAALHKTTSDGFGLEEDNYIGRLPQRNRRHPSWASFLTRERIRPVMKACFDKKLLSKQHLRQFETLDQKMDVFFEEEPPALLHGDLWSGNLLCNGSGEPLLIDPAVYYGHRSMDLAMTALFPGFPPSFYDAYHYHFPLPKNHEEQWDVCNLYPLLVHLYLFGTSYLPPIEKTLLRFAYC